MRASPEGLIFVSTPAAPFPSASALGGLPPAAAWREELQERVREHRRRRGMPVAEPGARNHRTAGRGSVAARVAERYKDAPSYRQLLETSAAAAETAVLAALEAQAAAQAALACFSQVQHEDVFADPFFASPTRVEEAAFVEAPAPVPVVAGVEHHAPLPPRVALPERVPAPNRARALVDAFAEAVVPAAQSLPAKLIEFPRELIAPRKQRPRLAEGPLSDEPSLRIFEVGAAEDSMEGSASASMSEQRQSGSLGRGSFTAEPHGWGTINLDEHPQAPAVDAPQHRRQAALSLEGLAPVSDRCMSALVDGGVVFAVFLLAAMVFAECGPHTPSGKAAIVGAGLALGVLAVFYGWLFMSFGGGSTPGMRYARIALCTFEDENPTRRELQNRVPATALALLPLGLGVLWALLDEDRLGWHDRMTRTYQRAYR